MTVGIERLAAYVPQYALRMTELGVRGDRRVYGRPGALAA
jgi:hypothetical protein